MIKIASGCAGTTCFAGEPARSGLHGLTNPYGRLGRVRGANPRGDAGAGRRESGREPCPGGRPVSRPGLRAGCCWLLRLPRVAGVPWSRGCPRRLEGSSRRLPGRFPSNHRASCRPRRRLACVPGRSIPLPGSRLITIVLILRRQRWRSLLERVLAVDRRVVPHHVEIQAGRGRGQAVVIVLDRSGDIAQQSRVAQGIVDLHP